MTDHPIDRLFATIVRRARQAGDADASYTAGCCPKAWRNAPRNSAKKRWKRRWPRSSGDKAHLAAESADALYHLLVLWAAAGITPEDVYAALKSREGQSGLAEKASRTK